MHREIKFRAWDTERKIFVPQGEIVFSDYGETAIEVHPNDLVYVGDSCHNGEPQRSRFIVIEFFGKKDKNGDDIYEDFICEAKFRTRETIKQLKGVVVMDEFMWCLDCTKWDGEIYSINRLHDLEIIGNIYENPELLTTHK